MKYKGKSVCVVTEVIYVIPIVRGCIRFLVYAWYLFTLQISVVRVPGTIVVLRGTCQIVIVCVCAVHIYSLI
jgi:hypothetical protein